MDFRDFTFIQAIAQAGTLSKAASQLFVSQPSLTKFLQKLEKQIGTPLFKRVNRRMIPTYAGQKFLDAGSRIFQIQSQLKNTLKEIANHSTGSLNIAITTTRGHYVLPKILARFREQYPDYQIEVMDLSVSELENALRNGTADLAVYSLTERNKEFHYYHINTEEVVLCLPWDHPYSQFIIQKDGFKYPWIDLTHLQEETFLINDPRQWRIGQIAQRLLTEYCLQPRMILLRSLDTCLALASRHIGCTLSFDICISCFHDYEKPPVYVSVGKDPLRSEFLVGTRKGHILDQAQKDFISILREQFGEMEGLLT